MDKKLEQVEKRLKKIEDKQNYIIELIRQSLCPPTKQEIREVFKRCNGDGVKAIDELNRMRKMRKL